MDRYEGDDSAFDRRFGFWIAVALVPVLAVIAAIVAIEVLMI